MAPPPFSDGGQPESYTSPLLPGSREQSSPMSDFTTELDSFLTQPRTSQESPQPLPETGSGSLGQAPVNPPRQPQHQHHQRQPHVYINNNNLQQQQYLASKSQSSNPSALVNTTPVTHRPYYIASQQMWHSPSSVEELDHYTYDDSSACASGTSNSNFSPASPAATWPSPATSFQHPPDRLSKDTWGDFSISTPVSVDFSASASDISPLSEGGIRDTFDGINSEWQCEPLATTALADLASLDAASCPASPTGLPMSTSAYMVHPNAVDSQAGPFDLDMERSRASEPPAPGTAEQQIPYAQLIYKALMQAPDHSMSLQDIYQWFQDNTDKCKPGQRGWMNSIRHNLSMNAGFVKRDRKREAESVPPGDADDGPSTNSDPKRSTEWTLTDEAISVGIQSTTRYRNKKSDGSCRDRDRRHPVANSHHHHHHQQFYHQQQQLQQIHRAGHSLRLDLSANRLHRSRDFPNRVSKAHRHGGGQQYAMRMAPTSGYMARTSSPYYQNAFMDQAMAGQQQQQSPTHHQQQPQHQKPQESMKMEPGLTMSTGHHQQHPPPQQPSGAGADPYGIMVPDHGAMMHTGTSSSLNLSAAAGGSDQQGPAPMYQLQGPALPAPPHGPFPYDTSEVNLGYPAPRPGGGATLAAAAAAAGRSASRLFDPGNINMPDGGFCEWPAGTDHGY